MKVLQDEAKGGDRRDRAPGSIDLSQSIALEKAHARWPAL
jgi:hypothetical protein